MGQWVAAIMAVLAVSGQAANVFLNLKLQAKLLESEKHILGEVADIYKRKDLCPVEITCPLEDCPLALRRAAG